MKEIPSHPDFFKDFIEEAGLVDVSSILLEMLNVYKEAGPNLSQEKVEK